MSLRFPSKFEGPLSMVRIKNCRNLRRTYIRFTTDAITLAFHMCQSVVTIWGVHGGVFYNFDRIGGWHCSFKMLPPSSGLE